MSGFVKIDCNILYSSIWAETPETKTVWITMLALANANGIVPATAPGISLAAVVPLEATRKALVIFESPDPDSKSLENKGRRVERIDGGYRILNYESYRAFNYSMKPAAIQKREYREKHKSDNVLTMSRHSASASASESSFESKTIERVKERYTPSNSANELINIFLSTLSSEFVEKFNARENWGKCFDRLLKEFDTERLKGLIAHYRQDNFWCSNFMSPLKLLKKNREGIRYVDYFFERLKNDKKSNQSLHIGAPRRDEKPQRDPWDLFMERFPAPLEPIRVDFENYRATKTGATAIQERLVELFKDDPQLAFQLEHFLKGQDAAHRTEKVVAMYRLNYLTHRFGVPEFEQ